jgi:hypothetical protein
MQNKFESELANRIAEKGRLWSPRQLGVLVAAIAACALIVGASALSLPITANGSGNSPITFEPLIEWKTDYLVPGVVDVEGVPTDMLTHADNWDSTYDVMRTVNLKADSFLTPGTVTKQYSKWTYTTTVKLQDVSMMDTVLMDDGITTQIKAVKLGTLEIYDVEGVTLDLVGYGISLNGAALTLEFASYAVASQDGDVMTIEITLPQGSYVNGDEVNIFVMYKADMDWSSSTSDGVINFDEEAFPGIPDYVAP